mgnify:CR=1 FL=1
MKSGDVYPPGMMPLGMMQPGMQPHGMPHGMMPHGMQPHGMPPGMPPGMPQHGMPQHHTQAAQPVMVIRQDGTMSLPMGQPGYAANGGRASIEPFAQHGTATRLQRVTNSTDSPRPGDSTTHRIPPRASGGGAQQQMMPPGMYPQQGPPQGQPQGPPPGAPPYGCNGACGASAPSRSMPDASYGQQQQAPVNSQHQPVCGTPHRITVGRLLAFTPPPPCVRAPLPTVLRHTRSPFLVVPCVYAPPLTPLLCTLTGLDASGRHGGSRDDAAAPYGHAARHAAPRRRP